MVNVIVDAINTGDGDMKIAIWSSSEKSVANEVREISAGHFEVNYTPSEAGLHKIFVTFNGIHVPGML